MMDHETRRAIRVFGLALASTKPTIAGYRVYRQSSRLDDVRVRILPAIRMELLAHAMSDAREVARPRMVTGRLAP